MEHLNQTFFLWLNAPEHANALVVTLATFFAEWLGLPPEKWSSLK